MTRESADVKGRRYLSEGRLRLERVDQSIVTAVCRGMGETYSVGYQRGGWWCDCAARGRCAHLVALQLVVDRPGAVLATAAAV